MIDFDEESDIFVVVSLLVEAFPRKPTHFQKFSRKLFFLMKRIFYNLKFIILIRESAYKYVLFICLPEFSKKNQNLLKRKQNTFEK